MITKTRQDSLVCGVRLLSALQAPQVVANDGISQQASLLVSILVRYSEISSVRFIADHERLAFSVMLRGVYDQANLESFRQAILKHLEAYSMVTGHKTDYLEVNAVTHGHFTQVEFVRDVATVSREELSLVIGLIRSHFGQDLVIENDEFLLDDERIMQEELIDDILEDVRVSGLHRELVGFRDAGRVMVFNKGPRTGRV